MSANPITRHVEKHLRDYSDEEIRDSLQNAIGTSEKPIEQIISVAESVFELIDENEEHLPRHLVKPLWNLQQLFRIHANLVLKNRNAVTFSSTPLDMDFRDDSLTDLDHPGGRPRISD